MQNNPSAHKTYARLLRCVLPYWPGMLFGLIGTLMVSSLDALVIGHLRDVVDHFNNYNMLFIRWLPVLAVMVFVLRGVFSFVGTYSLMRVSRNVVRDFRINLFKHFIGLPAKFFDQSSSGQLLAVILYNVDKLSSGGSDALLIIARNSAYLIGLLFVMIYMSWHLTLLFLIIMPLITIVVRLASMRQRRLAHKVQDSIGDLTRTTEQSLQSYKVVRIFGGQDYEKNVFDAIVKKTRNSELKVVVTNSLNTAIVQVLMSLPIAVAIYFATSPAHGLTRGEFISFAVAVLALIRPVRALTTVNSTIQSAIAAAESIFSRLAEALEPDTGKATLPQCAGQVRFDSVCFAYSNNKTVLDSISFVAEPGHTVALVGHSGSGKSTLVSLLPRFYEPQSGSISIDGTDISKLGLLELRSKISYVTQQVDLFDTTIRENIAYGEMSSCTDEQVIAALQLANAWEFVSELPDGLNTIIGERGVLLSGGQRQRLAIARALLKKSPILILDEATASLDSVSEHAIQAGLEQLMSDRTTLVIAHRLSTIVNADMILVMDKGKIIEFGTHNELLKSSGQYKKLYDLQFANPKK